MSLSAVIADNGFSGDVFADSLSLCRTDRKYRDLAGKFGVLALMGLWLGWAGPTQAATIGTTMSVTATVISSCSVSANNMLFGNYDPISAVDDTASATMSVTCTNGTSYTVGISVGGGTGASVASRKMTQTPGGALLNYSIYRDSGYVTAWTTSGGTTYTGTGVASVITMYGQIPAQQTAPAGSYQDTLTITVTY